MKLLVLLLSLLVLHFLPLIKIKANVWLNTYAQLWLQTFRQQRWFQGVAGPMVMAIMPIIVVNLARGLLVSDFLVSLLAMCLCLSVTDQYAPLYMTPPQTLSLANQATPPSELWRVCYRLVTPVFWYLFLGTTGLLLYTFFWYAAFCSSMPVWQNMAVKVYETAAWLPCRFVGLAYAISGRVKPTLKVWGEWLMLDYRANHAYILACAAAAYSAKQNESSDQGYQYLLRDAQILLLGLFAVINMLVTLLTN